MRFLANEDLPLPRVRVFSEADHDVAAIILETPGASDEEVLERAAREGQTLLTFDREHGRLLYRQGAPVPESVIYFRFDPSFPEEPAEYLLGLPRHSGESLSGIFIAVERDRVEARAGAVKTGLMAHQKIFQKLLGENV